MWWGTVRCNAPARGVVDAFRGAAFLSVAALGFAGCSSSALPPGISNISQRGTTVAFESIDGPPETVFRNLVRRLDQEARAQQVSVVSRESAAQYRVRGYVAAHVQGKKTTITWVWDVFDADRERAVRLAGEIPGAPSERAWAAADDEVVARMARDGMTRLAAFLSGPGSGPESPSRDAPAPNVASVSGTEGPLAFLQQPSRP